MRTSAVVSFALAAVTLTGCGGGQVDENQVATVDLDQPAGDARPTPPPPPQGAQGIANESAPDLSPAQLTPEAEKGEKGARNVLLSFIRAIELREFDQAWEMMRGQAHESMSSEPFGARFDGFGKITVAAPVGSMEGAAGTLYYSAPATITGSNGQVLKGEIVLGRVNDVPGASEEQLRWRVARFNLASDD